MAQSLVQGWERPETEIYLSKRTRFCIRTPIEHAQDFHNLNGETLEIGAYKMTLSKPTIKELVITDTLFCRTVVVDNNQNEDEFLKRCKFISSNNGNKC